METAIKSTTQEVRQGKTGKWTFVMKTPDNRILAYSEWHSVYEFSEKCWNALPVVT